MSDNEYDYMSDEILGQGSKDVRPGLIQDRSKQRLVEIEKRKSASDEANKKRHKSQASLEAETREKGLQEAIPADNKGFEILQKMGYKPGEALGKTAKGPLNPVKIEVKGDRSGLGRKSSTKLIMAPKKPAEEKAASDIANIESEVTTEDFRKRITSDAKRRYAEMDLAASQRANYNLDLENGYEKPFKSWYWPDEVMEKVNEAMKDYADQVYGSKLPGWRKKKPPEPEVEEEIGTEEKLAELTEYLRNSYYYCVWCGATYKGKSDIAKHCPGPSRELH